MRELKVTVLNITLPCLGCSGTEQLTAGRDTTLRLVRKREAERENVLTGTLRQLGGAPGAVSLTVAVLPTRESEASLASVGNPGQIETSLILSPHYQRIILPTCTRMFDIFSPGSRWEYLQVLRI